MSNVQYLVGGQNFQAVSRPTPTIQHPCEERANSFVPFWNKTGAVSTLGASTTFSNVSDAPVAPRVDHGFSEAKTQKYNALLLLF